jgi:CRP/FNR family cyclic AMP-dependent transcriptional regulator
MTSQVVLDALQRHPFAAELEPAKLERLASLAHVRHLAKDEILFREGEHNEHFYLIIDGPIALEMGLPRGMLLVQRLGPGDGLGWSAALVGRGKYFQARALDAATTLEFEGSAVLATCHEDPAFGFMFMMRLLDVVSKRLQATRVQLADMHSPVAKQAGT